jgi:hypothetical protein
MGDSPHEAKRDYTPRHRFQPRKSIEVACGRSFSSDRSAGQATGCAAHLATAGEAGLNLFIEHFRT